MSKTGLFNMRAGSSVGRAPRSQCGGRGFDPHPVQTKRADSFESALLVWTCDAQMREHLLWGSKGLDTLDDLPAWIAIVAKHRRSAVAPRATKDIPIRILKSARLSALISVYTVMCSPGIQQRRLLILKSMAFHLKKERPCLMIPMR